ncbi:FliM/FliN family flagellar motor switch protein [Acidocella sp.]|uniref:FliM/FliN family flagellar motor switch protein n=1 Tax=Acidocella sp. TaxID=50710 RepID=UPI00260775A1|nr:FliM/FliN family flagellar motor switch protein [Acidocella sp.]
MPDKYDEYEALDLLDTGRNPQLRSVLIESLSDRILRQISVNIFQKTRYPVQVLSCITNVITHESALGSLPDVMLAGMIDISPLRGRILVVVDGDLIGAIVDALCGSTASIPFERYELSSLEARIGKQLIILTTKTFEDSLAPLIEIHPEPLSFETSSALLAIGDAKDWVVVLTGIFETTLGAGTIKLIIPYSTLDPLEAKISNQSGLLTGQADDWLWAHTIEKLLDDISLNIRAELIRFSLPISHINGWEVGAILPISLGEICRILSDEILLFEAKYGQINGVICCSTLLNGENNMSNADADSTLKSVDEEKKVQDLELEQMQAIKKVTSRPIIRAALDRIEVEVTVELGRTKLTLKEARAVRHGQVLALDQQVGDPLSIYVNGQKFGYGEVVAVGNDRYGIRVTSLAEDIDQINNESGSK